MTMCYDGLMIKGRSLTGLIHETRMRGLSQSVTCSRFSNHHNTWTLEIFFAILSPNFNKNKNFMAMMAAALSSHCYDYEWNNIATKHNCIFPMFCSYMHGTQLFMLHFLNNYSTEVWREGCFFLWSYKIFRCICSNN